MTSVLALSLLFSAPAIADDSLVGATPISSSTRRNKSPLLAAGLNFFLPGTGSLYNGVKPAYVSVPMIAWARRLPFSSWWICST